MRFYKTHDNVLIQFNPETKVYRVRNIIDTGEKTLTEDKFNELNTIEIKKQKFSELMNIYFKDVKHQWQFEGSIFRKLDNFDKDGKSSSFDWDDLPHHTIGGHAYGSFKFVYHWGRIYYAYVSGNYYPQLQLFDTYGKSAKWTNIKNVAPIFNVSTKKVI